jgi:S1-C subfamily serine protease
VVQGTFGATASYLDPAHAAAAGLVPGALVTSVEAAGPAAAAGLKAGDIVTSVNGVAIDSTHPFDASVLGYLPGVMVMVSVSRARAATDLSLVVGSAA